MNLYVTFGPILALVLGSAIGCLLNLGCYHLNIWQDRMRHK